jgi:hypothetical protein
MEKRGLTELIEPVGLVYAESRTSVAESEIRNPGYWRPVAAGGEYWDTFQKQGLSVQYTIGADGKVKDIIFTLLSAPSK